MRGNRSEGSRYQENKDLDIVDLARKVKSGIQDMMSEGELPEMKVSVTSNRSPREVNVTFKSFPEDEDLIIPLDPEEDYYGRRERLSDLAKEVKDQVESYVESFNYNNCDYSTDFFDVHFYKRVSFDWKLKRDRRTSKENNYE